MDLVKRLEEYRDRERELQWEGTFAQYFEIATKKPEVTRLAHERIYRMIMDAGVGTSRAGEPLFNFFSDEIFGIERPLQQIVEYFHSAAQRLEVRKRILLLMGPVGGGKSTIVYLIKRGLEDFSRTNEGALYAIRDCPMHEEPLHLIPNDLRADVEKEFGLYIEGDLCPHCRYMVDTQFTGHIEDVPVKRLAFSEKYRVGVGTFTPSDPKSQDISELVGGIDLSTIGEVGVESDPRAYRFDGELNIANRGILVFVFIGMANDYFIGVDHTETPGFDVLFLTECEQDIEELLISFEHFYKFHDATVSDVEFAIEAVGSRIAFNAHLTNSGEVNAANKLAD